MWERGERAGSERRESGERVGSEWERVRGECVEVSERGES